MNLFVSVFFSDLRCPGNECDDWKWVLFSALQLASFFPPVSLPRLQGRGEVFHQNGGTIVRNERTRSNTYGAGAFEVTDLLKRHTEQSTRTERLTRLDPLDTKP